MASPRPALLVLIPRLCLSAGRHEANPEATYRKECWGAFPSFVLFVLQGAVYPPALSLVSAVPFLFFVRQSFCQVCNKNSSNVRDVYVKSGLVSPCSTPAPTSAGPRRGVGDFKQLSSHRASPLLGGWHPAGGARHPGLAPSGRHRPVLSHSCLPLPPIGSCPSETVVDNP